MAEGVAFWRGAHDAERVELQRSDRVLQQLQDVLGTFRARNEELAAESERLQAEARADPAYAAIERELSEQRGEHEAAEEECAALRRRAEAEARELAALEGRAEARRAAALEAEAQGEELERRRQEADARREDASARARSMVAADTLRRAAEDADALGRRLAEQEGEAARLRQALVDSWAARADPGDPPGPAAAAQDLDNVEEELKWIMTMQQESSAEVHRMQHLEGQEMSLQRRLRELSEEKASLQSARVDLGNAGATLREAVASQSEGWVRRVDDLEQQRRTTDQDRVKLLSECADLQQRLAGMAPELEIVRELEARHSGLDADRRRLEGESRRLCEVNGALGVLLLGPDASPPPGGDGEDAGAVAEAIARVLQLQRRLNERTEAQALEKQKLAERLRELERLAAQPGRAEAPPAKARPAGGALAPPARGGAAAGGAAAGGAAPAGGALASAGSAVGGALRGGLGRLREAAASAVL